MMARPRPLFALVGSTLLLASSCSELAQPAGVGERVREVLSRDDLLIRARDFGALLAELPPDALPQVREAVLASPLEAGDPELALLATWWARFDPEGARDWVERAWLGGHLSTLAAVFRTWAQRDPKTAWEAAQEIAQTTERNVASDAVIAGWHDSGAPGLVQHIIGLEAGVVQQFAAETLARRKAAELGALGALEWAEGIPNRDFAQFMLQRVAGAAAWRDPAAAAEWVRPKIDDGPRTSGLARRVATRWVRSDPEAALRWLSTLPRGGDLEDGLLEAFRDWLKLDREAAIAWIEVQEPEPWLEPALSLYARGRLQARDPEAALELAARFSDPDRRNTTSTYIARSWLRRDWEAADAWLKQSDLPPDVVQRAYMVQRHSPERSRAALEALRAPPPKEELLTTETE